MHCCTQAVASSNNSAVALTNKTYVPSPVSMTHGRRILPGNRFVAPREDRSSLVIPPFDEVGELVAHNLRIRESAAYTTQRKLQGRTLFDLSLQARSDLIAAAQRWTATYRPADYPAFDSKGLVFVAGHQPELFHPGVWFKNFALGAIAQQHGATAINLVIDSDVMKSNALIAPGGCSSRPMREAVPFDKPSERLPFEERPILDHALFGSFGHRVTDRIAKLVPQPLVQKFWPMVLERAKSVNRIGYCIAQARHKLEGEWGVKTLEVPQSAVCDGEAFYWFLTHLLSELPRFRNDYNKAVHEYRQANHIRNAGHPVPDLISDGPWIEAPFWIWTTANPERRRMFAMRRGSEIVVSDREGWELRLPLSAYDDSAKGDASDAVAALSAAARTGVRIRTRALATTLWARLALSDLFLHGIGGAKYDQVTDRLIESFFELSPPGIMVLSATLLLPVDRPTADAETLRSIRRDLRELTYHPEKYMPASPATTNGQSPEVDPWEMITSKRRWIETPLSPENAYARHCAIDRINLDLQPWVAPRRKALLAEQNQTERDLRCNKILGSRDQGFCLFPERTLQDFFLSLLPKRT